MTTLETLAGELDRMNGQFNGLLSLVARIKSGEVDPARVEVDLLGRSWQLLDAPPVTLGGAPGVSVSVAALEEMLRERSATASGSNGKAASG